MTCELKPQVNINPQTGIATVTNPNTTAMELSVAAGGTIANIPATSDGSVLIPPGDSVAGAFVATAAQQFCFNYQCEATTPEPVADNHCDGGLVERRFGYGAGVTPPTNIVTVSTWDELEAVIEPGNVWARWSSAVANTVVPVTSLISAGPNVWVDGYDAPGAIFRTASPGTRGISFRDDNGVVSGMEIDSDGISSTRIWFLRGQHYWADKIETYGSNDDVVIMSSDGQPDLSGVTVSYIYTHGNSRGMLVNAKTTNGSVRRITICNSWFRDNSIRNWRWQASDEMHSFNNFVEDCSIGINGRITAGNVGSNLINRAIIESSVWENVSNPLNIQNPGGALEFQYEHWAYTDGLNDYGGGSNVGQIDAPDAPAVHSIPYSYIKMPTAEVKAHVQACAGVQSL